MPDALLLLPLLCPALLLLAALWPGLTPRHKARLGAWFGLATFGMALIVAVVRVVHGPLIGVVAQLGPVQVGVHVDTLAVIMRLLVSFLGAVTARFAVNYLDGECRQGVFTRWLCATIACVLALIVSGNLLLFTFAWIGTSLCLHQLLTYYGERPAARLAACKKFLISRLGDACMLSVLVLTWRAFGTWNFAEIFATLERLRLAGAPLPGELGWIAGLLVTGAMAKSAQFPFHSWLPDTMETPTPVSALMHAGIINAGGYLIVRLSPVVALVPGAMNTLVLVGAFTAVFASLIMLTQTSVKRSLAYSTIAQMGFMMLECGLGAFALAVLHIVAHSLYKAHAFLSSGSIVRLTKAAWVPSGRPPASPASLALVLCTALGVTTLMGGVLGVRFTRDPGVLVPGSIFVMALAYLFWNVWASSHRVKLAGWGLGLLAVAAAAYFSLHLLFTWLLAASLPPYAPARHPSEYVLMGAVVLVFMFVLILQAQFPVWSATKLGRSLYVHAYKGFYFVTLANRLTLALAPRSARPTF